MTRPLHSIRPVVGQDVGGRGSTNSGGSRSSSEYSLTRSTATLKVVSEGTVNKELESYHRLLETNKLSNHEQQIISDRRSESQSETCNGCVHERENRDKGNATDDEAGENVETRRDPSVHCAAVRYDSSRLASWSGAHLPTSSSTGSSSGNSVSHGGVVEQHQSPYRIGASKHVPHELGRCTEGTQDADSGDGLSIQGVQRRTGNGVWCVRSTHLGPRGMPV